ncbi:unnamed protein product [Triticum turgidum subsp. durum]|uniref:Uncharacterized protein n=1 Tax=Triticum turgidum subsp. durum TaxID=4567 RepID=A0A9R1PLD4_TRITD|nr:unnamed protein product [Triticum turgidum subsp. durum]
MESYSYANGAKFDCLLFDMDETLYPLSLGINIACRKNIQVQNIYARCLGAPRRHPPAHLCLSMGSGSSTAGQPHGSRQFDALCRAMFNAPLSSTRTTFRPRLHL